MPHSTSSLRVFVLFCALAITVSACKSRKQKISKYKYLTEENPKNPEEAAVTGYYKTLIDEANTYLGTPYRYGGINKNGIDCSGLTTNAFKKVGVGLPRSAKDQMTAGRAVRRDDIRPGDLVFFSAKNNGKIDHVGLVVKRKGEEITFIHSTTRKGVRHDRLDEGYWVNLYKGARRISLD